MIIGLTGYARVGKDTVANILVKDFGFTRVAFADPIRDLLFEMNPLVNGVRVQDMVKEYGWEITKSQMEVRRLLQNLGVGARTLFGTDFWIDKAFRNIQDGSRIVVTDVRFINEATWIKNYEYSYIWRVKRDGVNAINAHVSETEMATYPADFTILNEFSMEHLHSIVSEQMDFLGAKKES